MQCDRPHLRGLVRMRASGIVRHSQTTEGMMRTLLAWIFVMTVGMSSLGCGETPNLQDCEGAACDVQEDCVMQCEDICEDPDFGSFDCVENICVCQCFFGCN